MDRLEIVRLLSMLAIISQDTEAINCVANYVKLGGEINEYVEGHIDRAKNDLNRWIHMQSAQTPTPQKRKYTRRNLNPTLQDEDNNTVKIYCEGTCSNIGKPNAKAGIGIFCHITVDGEVFTRELYQPLTPDEPQSNQRAELRAIYMGIQLAKEIEHEFANCSIELVISSLYAHRSIYEWADGWKNKEWKGVKHADLLANIINEISSPCRLIKKDSQLTGYTYARSAATKAIFQNETPSDVSK